jgi:hypothetical protein
LSSFSRTINLILALSQPRGGFDRFIQKLNRPSVLLSPQLRPKFLPPKSLRKASAVAILCNQPWLVDILCLPASCSSVLTWSPARSIHHPMKVSPPSTLCFIPNWSRPGKTSKICSGFIKRVTWEPRPDSLDRRGSRGLAGGGPGGVQSCRVHGSLPHRFIPPSSSCVFRSGEMLTAGIGYFNHGDFTVIFIQRR